MRKTVVFLSALMSLVALSATAQVNAKGTLLGWLFGEISTNAYQPLPAFKPRPADNPSDPNNQGMPKIYNGFLGLYYWQWPGRNLTAENVFNCEFLLKGSGDDGNTYFEPRIDYCVLENLGSNSASITWPAQYQAWNMDMTMKYTMVSNGMEMAFSITPRSEIPDSLGWIGLMWSAYVKSAINRSIYFWGSECQGYRTDDDGTNPVVLRTGWCELGAGENTFWDQNTGNMGVVSKLGVHYLPVGGAKNGSFVGEMRNYHFIHPFYYGLVDGDGDLSTSDDKMAWIMMFDDGNNGDNIRIAMYNFSGSTNDPAWDWQFIVNNPQIGHTYSYGAKFLYKPFVSQEDVLQEYLSWSEGLRAPQPRDANLYTGDSHALTVDGDFGAAPTFQWKRNKGVTVQNGPSTRDWTLANVTASDEGAYWCEISSSGIERLSNTATLNVRDHVTIANFPARVLAYAGDRQTFTVKTTGGYQPLLYFWEKEGEIIRETCDPSCTLSCLTGSDAGGYTVEAADSNGDYARANTATLTVCDHLAITSPLRGGSAYRGASHTFSVQVAGGCDPLLYVWQKDEATIPDASTMTFVIPNLKISDTGTYTSEVADAKTDVQVASTTLTVVERLTGIDPDFLVALSLLLLLVGIRAKTANGG